MSRTIESVAVAVIGYLCMRFSGADAVAATGVGMVVAYLSRIEQAIDEKQ